MWLVSDNKLIVDGKAVLSFPYNIIEDECREVDGVVIIVLDLPVDVVFPTNAYGYVLRERRVWQLGELSYYGEAGVDVQVTGTFPTTIPGQVILSTWAGVNLYVDVLTGEVLATEDVK